MNADQGSAVVREGYKRTMKDGWRETTLGDCVTINDSTYSPKESWPFINYLDTGNITENIVSEIQRLETGIHKIPSRARRKVQSGDIVYSTVRPNQKHFGLLKSVPENFLASTGFAVLRGKEGVADTGFIYWFLAQDHIVDYLHSIAENSTSAYPSIKPSELERLTLFLPPLPEQRTIAHILGTLQDKIDLNRRMNKTLEEMAQALFKFWFIDFGPVRAKMEGRWRRGQSLPGLPAEYYDLFPDRLVQSELGEIPEGWEVKPLDEIAKFQNGLALQKFRPTENASRLPVVKIAQLRSGHTRGAEWATDNITPDCIIDDGDVIFAWSGSLMVRVWRGGRAALNQHLFKVTSTQYPKWFYLKCIELHLAEFQDIAAGKATTMGHIKREHLKSAKCVVPSQVIFGATDYIFSNLFAQQNSTDLQSRNLTAQRDTLLPRLVSGEFDVGKVTDKQSKTAKPKY